MEGWSNADQTWEPPENLEHAQGAITEFYQAHPDAAQ